MKTAEVLPELRLDAYLKQVALKQNAVILADEPETFDVHHQDKR